MHVYTCLRNPNFLLCVTVYNIRHKCFLILMHTLHSYLRNNSRRGRGIILRSCGGPLGSGGPLDCGGSLCSGGPLVPCGRKYAILQYMMHTFCITKTLRAGVKTNEAQ